MQMAHFPGKRFIAVLLPISFLWLFVACVAICVRECGDHPIAETAASTESMEGTDCAGCPSAPSPKAVVSGRPQFVFGIQPSPVTPSGLSTISTPIDSGAFNIRRCRLSFAAPPLKRLPVLLI